MLRFLASPRGTAKPTLPQLNLHNIRVRRNPEPLPSSRCIERAQSHRAHVRILPTRASDTALRLALRLLARFDLIHIDEYAVNSGLTHYFQSRRLRRL